MLHPRMLHTKRTRSSGRSTAQALVEFSLTALLLLMLLMLIIEVARIFQTYVTLQNAARAGARYAITGQWDPVFSGTTANTDPQSEADWDITNASPNPGPGWTWAPGDAIPNGAKLKAIEAMMSGWDPTSPEPLKHIPPCWPRFAPGTETDNNNPVYYSTPDFPYVAYGNGASSEPYRSPRTCSIEATVIRSMAGLPLDPINIGSGGLGGPVVKPPYSYHACCSVDFNTTKDHEPYNDPGVTGHPANAPFTYTIYIEGYSATAAYPVDGNYGHPDWQNPYTEWDPEIPYDSLEGSYNTTGVDTPGVSPGFGGDPGQLVRVTIIYRFGLITPILSRIIPSFTMTGVSTMTNEMWGSTGVQSKALLPPPVPHFGDPVPTPADLIITNITGPTTDVSPAPTLQSYTVDIANVGGTDILSPFPVTLWVSDHLITQTPPLMPDSFLAEGAGVTKFGTGTVNASPGSPIPATIGTASVTIQGTFGPGLPGNKPYYLYAVVDSYDTAPPSGSQYGSIDEADVSGSSPNMAHEQNNVFDPPLAVSISTKADITTKITVDNASHATGDRAVYIVSVQNLGPTNTTFNPSIQITTDLQTQAGLITGASPKLSLRDSLGDPPVTTSGTFNEATGVWQVGPIPNGGIVTLSIPVTVNVTTNNTKVSLHITNYSLLDTGVTDPVASNNPMSCSAPAGKDDCKTGTFTVNGVDLTLAKSVDATQPVVEGSGNIFTYTLTATNKSKTTDAQNTDIYDVLPVGVTFVPFGATGSKTTNGCATFTGTLPTEVQSGLSTILVSGQTYIKCSVGTIVKNNGTATVKISAYANTGTGGQTLTNSGYVTSTGSEINAGDNSVLNVAAITVQSIDIQVTKTALPKYLPLSPTTSFKWTITATNLGTFTATNVVITDTIPTASLNGAPTVSVPGGTTWTSPNWKINSLPPNTSVQMTISATPKSGLTNGATFTNTAKFISADQTDTKSSNDTDSSTITMDSNNETDLEIQKTVSPTTAKAGDTVTYTFTVLNNGPKDATNIILSDTKLNNNTDASSSTMFFNYSGGTVPTGWDTILGQWGSFSLQVGKTKTFTMTLKVNGNILIPIFNNDAIVSTTSLPDQDTKNNEDVAPLKVSFPAVIFVNAGGTGCVTDVWGDELTGKPVFATQTFVPSKSYTPSSWGFYGTYTAKPPTSVNFIDYTLPTHQSLSAAGQNLMNCTIIGSNFNFRYDNLTPGLYQIALIFADPTNVAGRHRFKVQASTYRSRAVMLLNNFDVNKAIEAQLPKTPPPPEKAFSASGAHYLIKYFNFRVKAGKNGGVNNFLKLRFFNGKRNSTYTQNYAMLSGLGLSFIK